MSENKRKKAVALKYEEKTNSAPVIKAKGQGYIAEKILQEAKSRDIPVYEDPSLAELLGELDVNETIPEDLFQAVAEVFAFIYRLEKIERN